MADVYKRQSYPLYFVGQHAARRAAGVGAAQQGGQDLGAGAGFLDAAVLDDDDACLLYTSKSCGNGAFKFSVYPDSMPTYLELVKNGAVADIVTAGGIFRECFCGPCFGAGDTPANGEFSIRHTTRNFPNLSLIHISY